MKVVVNSPKGGTAIVDPFKKRIVEYKPSKEYLAAKAKLEKASRINAEDQLHKKRLARSFNLVYVFPKFIHSLFSNAQIVR